MNNPRYIIVHHSGGSDADPLADSSNFTFKECNELHKQSFNFISSLGYYVGYHYFIEKSGKLYQARKDTDAGAHTVGKNNESIGICLAGNFDATLPTEEQKNTLKNLSQQLCERYGIPEQNIVPHRKFAVKTCYGNKLPDTWAQDLALREKISRLQKLLSSLMQLFKGRNA